MPRSAEKFKLLRNISIHKAGFALNAGISTSIKLITCNWKEFHNPDYFKPVSDYNPDYC
jgi:hypothetical protein